MNDDFLKRLKTEKTHAIKDFIDIPDGYFETLKSNMLKRVEAQNRSNLQWRMRFFGAAASLVFLLGLYFVWHLANNTNNQKHQLEAYIITTDTLPQEIMRDTVIDFEHGLNADTLLLDEIPYEYLLLYLLEAEEFEF